MQITPLFRRPQGPQGCLEKRNCPLSLNLTLWCAKIGLKTQKLQKFGFSLVPSKRGKTVQSETTKFVSICIFFSPFEGMKRDQKPNILHHSPTLLLEYFSKGFALILGHLYSIY